MAGMWDRFWKLSWWIKGPTIIVLFIIVISIITSATGDGDDGDDGDQVVADATSTVETVAESPTDVPATIDDRPPFTEAECAYVEEVQNQIAIFSSSATDLSALLTDMSNDPTLLLDDVWKLDVSLQLAVLRVVYDSSVALRPPASLEVIHEGFLSGVSKTNDATFLFATAIDDIDPDLMLQASELIASANADFGEATPRVVAFTASHSGTC